MKKLKIIFSVVSLISCATVKAAQNDTNTVVHTLKDYQRLLTAISGRDEVTSQDSNKLLSEKWFNWEDIRSPNMNLTEQEAAVVMAGSINAMLEAIERCGFSKEESRLEYIPTCAPADDLRRLTSYPTNNQTIKNFQNYIRPLIAPSTISW